LRFCWSGYSRTASSCCSRHVAKGLGPDWCLLLLPCPFRHLLLRLGGSKAAADLAALAAGAVLCAAVVATELRSTRNLASLLMLLPLSFGYGYATVLQLNCALDRSPMEDHNMVVAYKVSRGHYKPRLGMSLPGAKQPSGENADRHHPRFAATVPMRVFNAVNEGGPVCAVMRDGGLGIRWYTAESCPWDGKPLTPGIGAVSDRVMSENQICLRLLGLPLAPKPGPNTTLRDGPDTRAHP
jgi:hypothetical protein